MLAHRSSPPYPACSSIWAVAFALSALLLWPSLGHAADADPEVLTPPATLIQTPGPWISTPTDPTKLSGTGKTVVTLNGGWYTAGGAAFGLYPPMTPGVNQAVRAKFKYLRGGTADVTVRRRTDAKGVTRSYSLRLDETGLLLLVEFSKAAASNEIERKSLLKPEKKLAVKDGDEVLLELIAIGDVLVAKVDGLLIGTMKGADTNPGRVSVYTVNMTIGGLQWITFEGTSEHAARLALGLGQNPPPTPAPPASAKPEFPAPPTIAGEADVRLRVSEIDGKFRALFDQLAGKSYKAGLEQLNQNYLGALKREETKAQQKGSLQDVLIYQNEARAVTEGGAEGEVAGPVKAMHEVYRKALAKLEADRDRLSVPAYEAYDKALKQYTAELTKAGRIEAAKQVNEVNQSLKLPGRPPTSAKGSPASGS